MSQVKVWTISSEIMRLFQTRPTFLLSLCFLSHRPCTMDFVNVRRYLSLTPRTSAAAVMRDAVEFDDGGAAALVEFLLNVRVNRKTRRSLADVKHAYNANPQPGCFRVLEKRCWSLYRLSLILHIFDSLAIALVSFYILLSLCARFSCLESFCVCRGSCSHSFL